MNLKTARLYKFTFIKLLTVIALFGLNQLAIATPVPTNGPSLNSFTNDDAFLDYIEKTTFQYFWNEAASNGLMIS